MAEETKTKRKEFVTRIGPLLKGVFDKQKEKIKRNYLGLCLFK